MGSFYSHSASLCPTTIGLMNDHYPFVGTGIVVNDTAAAIAATVIYYHQFQLRISLAKDALHTSCNGVF